MVSHCQTAQNVGSTLGVGVVHKVHFHYARYMYWEDEVKTTDAPRYPLDVGR